MPLRSQSHESSSPSTSSTSPPCSTPPDDKNESIAAHARTQSKDDTPLELEDEEDEDGDDEDYEDDEVLHDHTRRNNIVESSLDLMRSSSLNHSRIK